MSDAADTARADALAERLAALTPAQRAFVERRLRATAAPLDDDVIPRRSDRGPAPLSFSQALIWKIEQTAPGEATYNVPRALRIRGALDEARLRSALNALVRRHETLRTVYEVREGEPVQVVREPREVPLRTIDVRAVPPADREAALDEALRAAAREPFDLTRDLLLRAVIVHVADDDRALLLVSHHLASDDASAAILFGDLARAYDGDAAAQPEPALRYGDFAAWQRSRWRGAALEALLQRWRERLRGAPALVELPTDRPRPALPGFDGARATAAFGPEFSRSIAALAAERGTTPFAVLFAAFTTLLHRYSRSDDVLVASVFNGRARRELDGVLGYFSTVLPVRARFEEDPPFTTVLAGVHDAILDAADHADVPFDQLVLELGDRGVRDVPRGFNVMFGMAAGGPAAPSLRDLAVSPIALDRGVSRVDLTVSAALAGDGVRVEAEYRTELFDAATVDRVLANFGVLLESVVADPAQRVSALPLLAAAERESIASFAELPRAYPRDATLHALLAAQAARTPDAIAVEAEDASGSPVRLTYAALHERARCLGAYLRGLGVGPGVGVGVCTDRSLEAVIALLGVLNAGGYYVPLDPDYPAERIAFMLRDARVPVVLTLARLRATVPADRPGVRVVELDAAWESIVAADPAPLRAADATAGDPAYVIYTSGSTGVPKGVIIPHRAFVNFLTSMAHEPGLDASDVVLAVTTFSFDIAGLELWLPLLTGARLVLAPRAVAVDGRLLAQRIAACGATLLQATPSTWRLLLAAGWEGAPRLTMLCGGEALPPDLAAALLPRGRALWNVYGPTETTVWSALARVRADEPISLGRPVANTQLYVLEPGGTPAPLGAPGELWIGGDGVADGYLHRPELTAERFAADPFRGGAARMYRTGDLVRRHAGGRLEYLGRIDTQVKLRGFRIELGEIEAALGAVAGVRAAAAAVRSDDGDARLITWIAADTPIADDVLRAALRARLPAYMVPSAFVQLDALPLTPNGKLDRAALRVPDAPRAGRAVTPPRTATESAILPLFVETLRCGVAGIDDDFFELGGHSLLAMRLLDRIAAQTGVRITLRAFFERATVVALAREVDARAAAGDGAAPLAGPVADPNRAEAPLSLGQELLWLHEQAEPGTGVYNVPMACRVDGVLDAPALQRALTALGRRHRVLTSRFVERDGTPSQVLAGPDLELRVVDLREHDAANGEETARAWIESDARAPFDLERGPAARAALLLLAGGASYLIVVVHHIAFDGWSMGVLWRDLAACYAAELRGETPELPPPALQYADYAAWQREVLTGERFEAAARFWRTTLENVPPVELPASAARAADGDVTSAHQTLELSDATVERIGAAARAHGVTLFMTLLAAFQTLLHRYSGQETVLVGAPSAGRGDGDVAGVVGYFVNPLVFRGDLSGDPTFEELLRRTRETCTAAYEHASAPVESLLAGGARPRDPLFRAMIALGEETFEPTRFGDATLTPLLLRRGVSPFDLMLAGRRTAGGLRLMLHYRTARFDDDSAQRVLGGLRILLEAAAAQPATPISALPILADDERRTMLVEWNATEVPYRREATIAQLFAERAAESPGAVAVVHDGARLSYGDLDARANRLAHRLQRLGAGPEVPVGVSVRRSADMVVAVLAVVKAGAAYVPLDTAQPRERLGFMVADTGLQIVVAHDALLDALPPIEHVVRIDADDSLAGEPASPPPCAATAESAAYITYTSGSTGQPKGVVVTHRNVVRLVNGADYTSFGRDEAFLDYSPLSFDASTFDLWGPLLNGARCVLGADVPSLEDLAAVIRRERVTVLFLTSALFHQVVDWDINALRPLRNLLTGGDVLSPSHVRRVLAELPETRLTAVYGPTENTTFTTWFPIPPDWNSDGAPVTVPIGKPIANTTVYVLDDRMQPVPVGAIGRLFAGGDGVARGYHRRPELTAQRFVADPFSTLPGARLYDTGDQVRWQADGTLEFVGRLDQQVKLSGYRIELGEIESVLATHAGVEQSLTILRRDVGSSPALVTYYVARGDVPATALREHARGRLPEYMIPRFFVRLDAMPITVNGKMDRTALPLPSRNEMRSENTVFVAPCTAAEHAVARLFAEALGGERELGVDDDFFDLGGQSLLAMRLVARIAKTFRAPLTVRAFFAAPTVRGVVAALVAAEPVPGRIDAIATAVQALHAMTPEERLRRTALRERTQTAAAP